MNRIDQTDTSTAGMDYGETEDPFEFISMAVDRFSLEVFKKPYSEIQKALYPEPKYKVFEIRKRSGASRTIAEPSFEIAALQRQLLVHLKHLYPKNKPCVHGFVDNKSILTNANEHCEKSTTFLLNLDLEDFFPSISFYRLRGVFQKEPFNFVYQVATLCAHLCTRRSALPQGAPTSPFVSNLICRSLDADLMKLARKNYANYTRYADDITFSFSVPSRTRLPVSVCSFQDHRVILGEELRSIIETKHRFKVNEAKTRISGRRSRMEVTGLTINEEPNVKREFVNRIRGALHAWEMFGYPKAQERWAALCAPSKNDLKKSVTWKRQTRTNKPPLLQNSLWGKLLYLRMVKGRDNPTYLRLAERYNALCSDEKARDKSFRASSVPFGDYVRTEADIDLAVYVVEWRGDYRHENGRREPIGAQGTAFAYASPTELITCDHVFQLDPAVHSGLEIEFGDQRIENKKLFVKLAASNLSAVAGNAKSTTVVKHNVEFDVELTHRNGDLDLAKLRFVNGFPNGKCFIGASKVMRKNANGWLAGYPSYGPGQPTFKQQANIPAVFKRGGRDCFSISINIRKGFSGGPFSLAENGVFRVLGIALQGSTQDSGHDLCLDVAELDKWLNSLT